MSLRKIAHAAPFLRGANRRSYASRMQYGAVLMIDALGFKDVWEREGNDVSPQVLAKMHAMRKVTERDHEVHDTLVATKATFLSDSVVVGIGAREPVRKSATRDAMAVFQAACRALWMTTVALEREPRLAYRGCITFGRFEIDGPFILGPAIDEAAKWHDGADGAFVWLSPSAETVWQATPPQPDHARILMPYAVPIKGGRDCGDCEARTHVVSPLDPDLPPEAQRESAKRLLATFDVGPGPMQADVQRKRWHTEKLVQSVLATRRR
jgi:hypothetical protein